jgi:hypothetical protein
LSQTNKKINIKDKNKMEKSIYTIDDKEVTKEIFDAFLAGLKEVPHTWFCAETDKGGITGYDGADEHGVVYEYRAISEPGNNKCSIRKKIILH